MRTLFSIFICSILLGCSSEREQTVECQVHIQFSKVLVDRYTSYIGFYGNVCGEIGFSRPFDALYQIVNEYRHFIDTGYNTYTDTGKLPTDFYMAYYNHVKNITDTLTHHIPTTLLCEAHLADVENISDHESPKLTLAKVYTNAVVLADYCHQLSRLLYNPLHAISFEQYPAALVPYSHQKDTLISGLLLPSGQYLHLLSTQDLWVESIEKNGHFAAKVTGKNPSAVLLYYSPFTTKNKTYEVDF